MYEIHDTTGYVLNYYNTGEADRRYKILTPDQGVLIGQATSVRKEKSKLKHFLQRYNLIEIELVQAKAGYRITGGRLLENTIASLGSVQLSSVARIGELIERLSQGTDADSKLFEVFSDFMKNNKDQTPESWKLVELWGAARILVEFGYFDPGFSPDISPELFEKNELDSQDREILETNKVSLQKYIEKCIFETQL